MSVVEELLYNPLQQARMSPACFAMVASDGRWKLYEHLKLLDDLLLFMNNRQIHRSMTWMPPQHGKSLLLSQYFRVWYLGENPDDRFIGCSYGSNYAARWNKKARDVFQRWAHRVWGLHLQHDSKARDHWDILDHEGGSHSAGADASVTGEKGDIIAIDDPHKSRKEAKSPVIQLNVYEWYTDVVDTRLSKKGLINITQTRWDLRDLSGRILHDKDGNINEPHVYMDQELLEFLHNGGVINKDTWVILRLPGIAEGDDILGRKPGEALCEDLHPIGDLLAKKRRMRGRFDAQYQGTPIPDEGEVFNADWFKIIPKTSPLLSHLMTTKRGWDLAGTRQKHGQGEDQGPARTAGVMASRTHSNDFIIHNCETLREKPGAVRTAIKARALKDNKRRNVPTLVVHDPGQAAIDQMERYAEAFKGTGCSFKPFVESYFGSKEDRADNVADHAALFNIYLVEGDWNYDFIKEHTDFPNGRYKDRVDATSVVFASLFKVQPDAEEEDAYVY